VAESFWVITGTTKEHRLSGDVALAARSNATVVILMGMSKLPEIMELFTAEGKPDIPVAIIQEGTTGNEKVGIGTVSTMVGLTREQQLSNPAIIIIGEVVRHRARLLQLQQEYGKTTAQLPITV